MSGMRVGISRPLSTAIIEGGNGSFELAIGMEARVAWAWAWDGNLYLLLLEMDFGKRASELALLWKTREG